MNITGQIKHLRSWEATNSFGAGLRVDTCCCGALSLLWQSVASAKAMDFQFGDVPLVRELGVVNAWAGTPHLTQPHLPTERERKGPQFRVKTTPHKLSLVFKTRTIKDTQHDFQFQAIISSDNIVCSSGVLMRLLGLLHWFHCTGLNKIKGRQCIKQSIWPRSGVNALTDITINIASYSQDLAVIGHMFWVPSITQTQWEQFMLVIIFSWVQAMSYHQRTYVPSPRSLYATSLMLYSSESRGH